MNINENIKNFRTFRGVKQQELADALGKSKSVISNWERGENSPDVDSCEKMCKILNVTPNELFGWEENKDYLNFIKRMNAYGEKLTQLRSELSRVQAEIDKIENIKMDEELHHNWNIDEVD